MIRGSSAQDIRIGSAMEWRVDVYSCEILCQCHGRVDTVSLRGKDSNACHSLILSACLRATVCRRLRTPSPTTGGTGQHSKACSSGDDQGRLSSPIARCAAALGPQPLSDQDVDAIRKLVSRMATFAAYRACMPGGLEAVENMERWQCKVWTAEAEEHAARMRSQPAAPAKQQQRPRARGQQQQHVSTSKPVRNRTSARNKSGSSAVHQGSSKTTKAVASGRGSGATPAACAHQEHEAQASEPHKDSFSAGHESSCATATDMSLKEGVHVVT